MTPLMSESRKHLFLTGATGFFGRSILRHLIDAERSGSNPWRVTAMTRSIDIFLGRFPEFAGKPWLAFHEGDILHGASAFPTDAAPTHILHAAADATPAAHVTQLDRLDQIVTGTRHVLDFAKTACVKRLLLTSSGDVYGPQPANMDKIPEDYPGSPDPMNQRNAYGCGKRMAEHLCALYAQENGFEAVIARCFAFVGPDLPLDAHFAIGNFIRDAVTASELRINGDGTPVRSYMHQADLAIWLLKLLTHGKSGCAYNVGSDQPVTIAELAELTKNLLAPEKRITFLNATAAKSEARQRYLPDITKAGEELNLEISISLEDAILQTARTIYAGQTAGIRG